MPERDCGAGCGCDGCAGCIRWGSRCIIIKRARVAGFAAQFEAIKGRKLRATEVVTVNLTDMTLVDAAHLISKVVSDPIAVPVDKLHKTVKLKLKDKPLSQVIEKLGLVSVPRKRATASRA